MTDLYQTMKQYFGLIAILFLLFCNASAGQNLVPNFSFEDTVQCPWTADQIEFAVGWSKYSSNNINTTPDYFNSCSSDSTWGVPNSFFIYQEERRNCTAYMGLVTWQTLANSREHIGVQLNQPLVVGAKYYISFYTVAGGLFFNGDYLEALSNNIGLRLSTNTYNPSNPAPIDNFTHLRSTSIITDTVNWVRISGSIVADSAYNYLMLGNFYDDANTDTLTQNCATCLNLGSYYLVDDICVSTDSTLCNGGIDSLPCNSSVSVWEHELTEAVLIIPNPATDQIQVRLNSTATRQLSIYDITGRIIWRKAIKAQSLKLQVADWPRGHYVLVEESKTGRQAQRFVLM